MNNLAVNGHGDYDLGGLTPSYWIFGKSFFFYLFLLIFLMQVLSILFKYSLQGYLSFVMQLMWSSLSLNKCHLVEVEILIQDEDLVHLQMCISHKAKLCSCQLLNDKTLGTIILWNSSPKNETSTIIHLPKMLFQVCFYILYRL